MKFEFKQIAAAAGAIIVLAMHAPAQAQFIQKNAQFRCDDDPAVGGSGLSTPTSFVTWCVPRGQGCGGSPPLSHSTAVYPVGALCDTKHDIGSGQSSVMEDIAKGLNRVCDNVAGVNADVLCTAVGPEVICTDTYPKSGPQFAPFDICVNGIDIVDANFNPGDTDFVAAGGLVFTGVRKDKRAVPVLGSWGAGGLAVGTLGLGLALLRRRRPRRGAAIGN